MTDAEKAPMFDDVASARRVRGDVIDVYTSADAEPGRRPAVIFVHGGPVAPDHDPRDWPGYVGYASLAVASGLVGVVVRHRLYDEAHFPQAAEDVAAGIEQTRAIDVVDPDRIGLWCLSAGGPLAADWMRTAPPWLRCLVWTYPVLASPSGADGDVARFDALAALPASPDVPKLLVRVENEIAMFVPHQSALVDAARAQGAALDVIDIPEVDHGFEGGDDVPEHARTAVHEAMDWAARALRGGAPTTT